jgi:predicted alpha/beta-hydrolase family hydrolase
MSPTPFQVPFDAGRRLSAMLYPADTAASAGVLLVLAHGAGAGQSHPFMTRYARGLAERGLDVVTVNFPYMEAKRSAPDRAPVLEEAFRRAIVAAAALPQVRAQRLLIGGKSMGGRIATHLAAAPESWPAPADAPPLGGVMALGYPLKAPGGRGDRVSHLFKITVPTLIVQGTRDSFGGPDDVRKAIADQPHTIEVHPVAAADHSLAILKSSGKTQEQVDREVWERIRRWVDSCPG